ncbi:MAG: hypothetical protein O2782_14995, partial [bacterium]|nr:hypothetical protein [bacterium]
MHDSLIDMLECPACHGELAWQIGEQREGRIETAEAECRTCRSNYPTREGIGVFLTPDLPRDDLWEQMDSWLTPHLREHPEIERQLMDGPLESLGPADKRFRANVLEDRGQYDEAKAVRDVSWPEIYTAEYRAAMEAQTEYVLS